MKRALAAALLVVLAHGAAWGDAATAAAAFRDAEAAAKAGKWEEACRLYEASYQADAQLGALLNLAECNDHLGRIATAWAEFSDATDLAHGKHDPREARIKARADGLAPKLPRVHVELPKSAPPGLAITRDAVDITALAGTDVPVDPGAHALAAAAPGFEPWHGEFTATVAKTVTIAIPELVAIVVKPPDKPPELPPPVTPPPVVPVVHEGHVKIHTQPDAEIFVDGTRMGKGDFDGTVKGNGHTLRVVAPGMRAYQSELFVADGETRAIDIPLEKDVAPTTFIIGDNDTRPHWQVAVNLYTGVKLRRDHPLVTAARFEIAHRIGDHVTLGSFTEFGSIDTANTCGYESPGPQPATPFDFGMRTRFISCNYLLGGGVLDVHVLPHRAIDPYLGVAPSFRVGFASYQPYLNGMPQAQTTSIMPAVMTCARVGVDWHPMASWHNLVVGAFAEAEITIYGDERPDHSDDDGGSNKKGQTYTSMFGGLHSAVAF